MPIVKNVTQEDITVKIAGNYFNFKPGKARTMNKGLANWIEMDGKGLGLAVLPDVFQEGEEIADINAEEVARRMAADKERNDLLEAAVLDQYIKRHRDVIYNNQVSLRQDLERSNIKADPAAFASKGEMESMRLVAKYQKRAEDAEQAKIDEVKKLMKNVKEG